MENELEYRSIRDLVNLRRNDMLKANSEYQRGEVWSAPQKKSSLTPSYADIHYQ